jgi:CSLREA domain-containing protein
MSRSASHSLVLPRNLFATLVGAIAGFALLGSPATPARADQTFVVNRTDDPPPVMCGGSCSLREAVTAANGTPGTDTIQLEGGQTYTLSIPVSGAGGVLTGDLDISDDVNIETVGPGGDATIFGNGGVTGDRVLQITGGATTLRSVDVAGGVAPSDGGNPPHHNGGGVEVDAGGTFNAFDSTIVGNSVPALGDLGGGIFNNNGRVTLVRSNVAGNRASGGFGGGIDTIGPNAQTGIINSKLFDNDGFAGGGFASGGGQTDVGNSQLSFNTSGDGGAAFVGNGSVNFFDATINNNRTDTFGGALRATGGNTTFRNSTISLNVGGDGGGIAAKDLNNGGTITFANTIIAGNLDGDASDGMHPDCLDQTGGLALTLGFNIVGNAAGCALTAQSGDHIGSPGAPVDPGLAPGTSYTGGDGTGLTISLEPGSLALDNGNPAAGGCTAEDARGVPRSLGGRCDIGAWEFVTCANQSVNRVGDAADNTSDEKSLSPTDGDDGMLGLPGNDSLAGGAGNDGICGGKGKDTLHGGPGNDRLMGGKGHDVCIGGPGRDKAVGCEVERSIP